MTKSSVDCDLVLFIITDSATGYQS